MCGLVGVVRRPAQGAPPELAPLLRMLDAASARLASEAGAPDAVALHEAADAVLSVARTLRGPLGAGAPLAHPVPMAAFAHPPREITPYPRRIQATPDRGAGRRDAGPVVRGRHP